MVQLAGLRGTAGIWGIDMFASGREQEFRFRVTTTKSAIVEQFVIFPEHMEPLINTGTIFLCGEASVLDEGMVEGFFQAVSQMAPNEAPVTQRGVLVGVLAQWIGEVHFLNVLHGGTAALMSVRVFAGQHNHEQQNCQSEVFVSHSAEKTSVVDALNLRRCELVGSYRAWIVFNLEAVSVHQINFRWRNHQEVGQVNVPHDDVSVMQELDFFQDGVCQKDSVLFFPVRKVTAQAESTAADEGFQLFALSFRHQIANKLIAVVTNESCREADPRTVQILVHHQTQLVVFSFGQFVRLVDFSDKVGVSLIDRAFTAGGDFLHEMNLLTVCQDSVTFSGNVQCADRSTVRDNSSSAKCELLIFWHSGSELLALAAFLLSWLDAAEKAILVDSLNQNKFSSTGLVFVDLLNVSGKVTVLGDYQDVVLFAKHGQQGNENYIGGFTGSVAHEVNYQSMSVKMVQQADGVLCALCLL